MSWICAQIGAREHYAVPRALHQAGRLGGLYTDFWAGGALGRLGSRCDCNLLRSLGARRHGDLAGGPLVSWNARALLWEGKLWRRRRQGLTGSYAGYVEVGRRFANAVRHALSHRRDLSSKTIFFAYDTGALEAMEFLRGRGIHCVVDQMDPNRVEVDMVRQEERLWPGWQNGQTEVPEEYFRRREQEWALADRVVVNSEFCRQALIQQGVSAEKLVVMPLCYEPEGRGQRTESNGQKAEAGGLAPDLQRPTSSSLRVLFLGQVILRKGIQYLIEAARQLRGEAVHFHVVGPIGISRDAVASAPSNVSFHGRVSRDQAGEWYRQSDMFVLPTISDGFAITQLEAIWHGLPVVTTPNCGEVVRHGTDGLVTPPRDARALAEAIVRFGSNRGFLAECSRQARQRSMDFTLEKLQIKLQDLMIE